MWSLQYSSKKTSNNVSNSLMSVSATKLTELFLPIIFVLQRKIVITNGKKWFILQDITCSFRLFNIMFGFLSTFIVWTKEKPALNFTSYSFGFLHFENRFLQEINHKEKKLSFFLGVCRYIIDERKICNQPTVHQSFSLIESRFAALRPRKPSSAPSCRMTQQIVNIM